MNLVVSSDYHLDHVTNGVSRFEDIAKSVDDVADFAIHQAKRDEETHFVMLGDLCDPDKNLSVVRAQEKLISVALRLARHKIPSHLLAGNHCVIEDGTGSTVLTPLRAIANDSELGKWINVYEAPGVHRFGQPPMMLGGWNLLALPYTPLSHAYDPVDYVAPLINDPAPLIVIGHLSIDGIVAGEETKEMPRGRTVLLPLGMLRARSARTIILNGHYHKRHLTPEGWDGKDVIIPGSLARLNFGEEHNDTGFLHLVVK